MVIDRLLRQPQPRPRPRLALAAHRTAVLALLLVMAAACDAGAGGVPPTPPITPGTANTPREVNIIAKDYLFLPSVVDLVPGETVLLHIVNGGLATHEVVIGDPVVQAAWEVAEAAAADPPPGPTPFVSVQPDRAGLRVVVASGERRDVLWAVPASGDLILGCHIPGHWQQGMQAAIRLVRPGAAAATDPTGSGELASAAP